MHSVQDLWVSKVQHALKADVESDGDFEAAPSCSSIKVLAEMTTFGAQTHSLVQCTSSECITQAALLSGS